jgi:RNA polymerase sigma factor (TIGR02999 family)
VIIFFWEIPMAVPESAEVTGLLRAWGSGDASALEQLSAIVYGELRAMARRYMRNERPGNTLQATALVNEVYLRLVDVKNVDWKQRAQFFALCSQIMRRILVDTARARHTRRRGGGAVRIHFDEMDDLPAKRDACLMALDEALDALSELAPRPAKVLELRYFGGLSIQKIGEVLEISPRTADRDWQFAKSWLMREVNKG